MSYFILLNMALPGVTYREGFTLATIYRHYQIGKDGTWNNITRLLIVSSRVMRDKNGILKLHNC